MINKEILENLSLSYDRHASEREGHEIQHWKLEERQAFLNLIQAENKKYLLEIGAGTGKDSCFFKETGLDTTSIDLSPEMVKLCRQKGLTAHLMSVDKMAFPTHSFDAIWSLNCLLHIPKDNISNALRKIEQVMKPSGLFYLGVYGGKDSEEVWKEDPYTPKRFFSFFEDDSLKKLVKEIFTLEQFKVIPLASKKTELHFQSLILRKAK